MSGWKKGKRSSVDREDTGSLVVVELVRVLEWTWNMMKRGEVTEVVMGVGDVLGDGEFDV